MANDKITTVSRRDFLKTSALAGGAVVASHFDFRPRSPSPGRGRRLPRPRPTNCSRRRTPHSLVANCNTGCGIKVKILDGVAVKIDGNPYNPSSISIPTWT